MLFHATQTHDYSTCHAHDEERKALMIKSMQSADSIGIKIVGAYADSPGHTLYFIFEANSTEASDRIAVESYDDDYLGIPSRDGSSTIQGGIGKIEK